MTRWRFRLGILLAMILTNTAGAEEGPPWVDLLKLIDTTRNGVVGEWQKTSEGLSTKATEGARIVVPHQPQGEYDYRVRFTRASGANSVALMFVAGGRQVTFDIDGWGQHLAGIQQVGGRDMREYRERVANVTLHNGQSYTATVQVRKDEVRALLDDNLVHSQPINRAELSLLSLWSLPDTTSLGLGAWDSATTFHSVEVRHLNVSPSVPSTPRPTPPLRLLVERPSTSEADDLASLSDEFDDPKTIGNWLRVFEVERTGADQLERFDMGRTQDGWMALVPYTSTWYRDYRGELVHKRVSGDFVVTTRVHTAGRNGRGAPSRPYSLAGIMVRTARDASPQAWRPGGENYIFLSHGSANRPGSYQFEVKTTVNSDSQLEINDTRHAEAEIRIARIGEHFVLLRREPERQWTVHRRYHRRDMPRELQVGMTVYTDYENASRLDAAQHNRTVIRNGSPDLVAGFDYFRFQRPQIPTTLQGRAFSDPSQVSDEDLLRFLGESLVR